MKDFILQGDWNCPHCGKRVRLKQTIIDGEDADGMNSHLVKVK